MSWLRREFGKEYSDSWHGRCGNDERIGHLPSKNQSKGSIDQPERWRIRFPIRRWNSKIVRKRLRIPSTHSKAGTTCKEWKCQWRNSRRIGESQTAEPKDDAQARGDFWSIEGDFIYRHHTKPRVQLYVPKEETFLILLKFIDVTRSTHADLDVRQEKKIDDYWNVDSCKHLPDSWRGFTKFTLLKEKLPKGYMWSGERDKDSNHYQTRLCMARFLDENW